MRQHRRLVFAHLSRIHVTNRLSGDPMGGVGDVSLGGLKLITKQPLAIGACYEIQLHVPQPDAENWVVDVAVICRWSRRDPRRHVFEIGCELDRPSPEYTKLVAQLIARR